MLSQGVVQALKYTVQRERPDQSDSLSFPSGHSPSMFATATVLLTMNGATVQSARVVMGAVAPIPWRSPAAEQALAGRAINEETAAAAAEAALKDARPLSQNAYKVDVAKVAVKRAILRAAGNKVA